MMACAARSQLSGRASASAAGRPASMRSTGSGSMITPVENGSLRVLQPSSPPGRTGGARILQPCSPVPALALPVLTTSARIHRVVRGVRAHDHRRRAEAVRVNTPAMRAPALNCITSKSCGSALDVRFGDAETPQRATVVPRRAVSDDRMKLFLVATVRAVDVVAELCRFGIHAARCRACCAPSHA
jgi:hypothetical protein